MASKKLLGLNRKVAIPVVIGGAAISGFMIYRYEKSKQAAASAAAAAQVASATNAYGYATASNAYGYGSFPTGYYGYGSGTTYGYGASGGFYPTGYYGYGVTTPPAVPNTTNAQWAQAAINQLQGEGYNPETVSGALGAYELGQPVTAAQVPIVDAAIAIEGYPPVPGANGYPPAIHQQGTPGGGGGGGQTTGQVSVPNVAGKTMDQAKSAISAVGLVPTVSAWTTSKGTKVATGTTPKAGASVAKGSSVHIDLKNKK
jgi:hypothetical protein